MVKKVEVWEAQDGKRFDEHIDAAYYDSIIDWCSEVMSELRPHEEGGAVQQDVEEVKKAYAEFMDLCAEVLPKNKDWFQGVKEGRRHPSHVQYLLADYSTDYPILWKTLFRFDCINMTSGIEYYQPYYVEHEDEWKWGVK